MFIGHDSPSSSAAAAAATDVCVCVSVFANTIYKTTRHDKVFETIIVFLFSHSLSHPGLRFIPCLEKCIQFFCFLFRFYCIEETIHILFINFWSDLSCVCVCMCLSFIQFAIVLGAQSNKHTRASGRAHHHKKRL